MIDHRRFEDILIADAFAAWRTCSSPLHPSSIRSYSRVAVTLARHGLLRVGDLSRQSVSALMDARLASGLKIATVNHDLKSIMALLRWLERRVAVPPTFLAQFSKLHFREARTAPPAHWTRDEVTRLLPEAYAIAWWFGLALELAIWTGARRTELRHEHREDYDLKARVLRLSRKTKNSKARVVSLCQPAIAAVLAHAPDEGPMFPAISPYARTPYISDCMFKWAIGELEERTGIPCTWHMARRTFTTLAIQSGIPVPEIARMLGHEGLTILYRHYYCWFEGYTASIERLAGAA